MFKRVLRGSNVAFGIAVWSTLSVCAINTGCEAKAKHEGGVAPERLSVASEACGRTADCADALRCVDGRCIQTGRSDVGDYHLAAGEVFVAKGELERGLKALRDAEAEYKRAGPIPTDVNCALGGALAAMRSDPLKAEEAAAKLHRCVQGLVDGSEQRHQALRHLASLGEAGFDPSHLASTEVSDRYLTRAPEKPKLDKLTVRVTADRKTSKKTFGEWMEVLASAEVKSALGPCWQAHWEATKKDEMVVSLPYRYSFSLHPEDESGDRGVLKTSKYKAPSNTELASATSCVDAALKPIADKMSRRGGEYSWTSKLTITVSP